MTSLLWLCTGGCSWSISSENAAGMVGTGATPSRCNAMFPVSSHPRLEAGEPMTGRVVQCQLLSGSVWGYSKPDLAEQPLAGTWLCVTGPGQLVIGQPLTQ
jgi:hypothetical protein